MTMTTSDMLVTILESTPSPKKLLTVHPKFVAPIYGVEAVIKVSGTFHGTVEIFLSLKYYSIKLLLTKL